MLCFLIFCKMTGIFIKLKTYIGVSGNQQILKLMKIKRKKSNYNPIYCRNLVLNHILLVSQANYNKHIKNYISHIFLSNKLVDTALLQIQSLIFYCLLQFLVSWLCIWMELKCYSCCLRKSGS